MAPESRPVPVANMTGHARVEEVPLRGVAACRVHQLGPATGKRRNLNETVHGADNRVGAKAADARLAELTAAVESGATPAATTGPTGPTVAQFADRWQRANKPRHDERTGIWSGWSPKTAKTHADNVRLYLLPGSGRRRAASVSGTDLDDLYAHLADERDLSLALVNRCHSQPRVMFNRALRKKLVDHNPALSADPVKLKEVDLAIPSMTDVRAVQAIGPGCLCRPPPGSRHRRRSQGKHGGTTSQARRRAEPATPVHARDRRGSGRSGREGHEGRPTVRRHPRQGTCAVLGEHLLGSPTELGLLRLSSMAKRSSSPTMGAARTGTSRGHSMPGGGTHRRRASGASTSTTCGAPPPVRC